MSSRSLNKVQLIGNMAVDPTIKYTPSGAMVCTFVVATNRRYTKADGSIAEEAEFSPIAVWGKLAEICQRILAKGMLLFVEGRLRTRSWEGQDGTKRYRTEVRALDVILLNSKDRQGAGMPADMGGAPAGGTGVIEAGNAKPVVKKDDDDDGDKKEGKELKNSAKPAKSAGAEMSEDELEAILDDAGSGDSDDSKK